MWFELEISQLHNNPLEESSDQRVTTIFQFLFSLSSTTWRRLPEGGAFCKLALMQSKLFSTLPKQCLFQLSEACILIQWGVFYTVIVCKTVICRQVKCTKIMSCLWCTLISEAGRKNIVQIFRESTPNFFCYHWFFFNFEAWIASYQSKFFKWINSRLQPGSCHNTKDNIRLYVRGNSDNDSHWESLTV